MARHPRNQKAQIIGYKLVALYETAQPTTPCTIYKPNLPDLIKKHIVATPEHSEEFINKNHRTIPQRTPLKRLETINED